ncbi:MAG: proprotein convertase P-domain-containing protein [Anaerolineae bacterium]
MRTRTTRSVLITAFLAVLLLTGASLLAPVAGQAPVCPFTATGSNDTDVSLPDLTPWVGSSITLTAPNTAVVTQVTFSVVIRHTFRGDLQARITNEDGSLSYLFHDRAGGGTDDLVGTWSTDVFNGEPAAQGWKLEVRDLAGADVGYIDSWSIEVCYEDTATPTPVTSPTPATTPTPVRPACTRADVAVIVYGAWEGTPVEAYVGGTRQTTLHTAADAQGRQAVLWTFYPPTGAAWEVSVVPQLPAGLDPARWRYELLSPSTSSSVSVSRCSQNVLYFQLVDGGSAAQ